MKVRTPDKRVWQMFQETDRKFQESAEQLKKMEDMFIGNNKVKLTGIFHRNPKVVDTFKKEESHAKPPGRKVFFFMSFFAALREM